jgi:hypothetical protein
MRSKMLMLMAMTMAFGMPGMSMGAYSSPSRRPEPKPKQLSPEEEQELLKQRTEKFISDLEKGNADRQARFPKWKTWQVNGHPVVASNFKNAYRHLISTLKENGLTIHEENSIS